MAGATHPLSIDRAERRRVLMVATLVVCVVGAVDVLAHHGEGARLEIWSGWALFYAFSAWVIVKGPTWVAVVFGLATALAAVTAMLSLARIGGGSRSPLFLLVSIVPLLSAVVVPEDVLDSAMSGLFVLVGGVMLLVAEGQPMTEVALWASMTATVLGLAMVASVRHRRRQEATLARELERASMLERLAQSERAREVAERWATIGRVADAVAHDVNSPLGSLRSNLAFAREELMEGRTLELDEALRDGQESAERIKEIVTSLQAFSRSDPSHAEAMAAPALERAGAAPGEAPGSKDPAAPAPSRIGRRQA
jgi:His Kinase A (phospho-acceptor) domain